MVLSDHICELGEGPSYDPDAGALYWFDILGRTLLERADASGATAVHDLPFMGSAIASVDAARQLVVAEDGLYLRDRRTGALALHTAIDSGNGTLRSNDARVHPSGALWFSTMGKKAEHRAGAIHWYRAGETRLLFPGITIPNSICFSADGATAYFTDTRDNILFRVDCDPATGLPTGEPRVFRDHAATGAAGGLDGAVVDSDGVLWNARWGAGCVDAFSPDGGLLRSIPVATLQPSCPAFFGRNADRLAITTAREGMDDAARAADPLAGRTLLLDIAVAGRFEPRVLL